ncbi:MAG: zf-TFIIB domain-containing protein [Actinomycetota bacterium]
MNCPLCIDQALEPTFRAGIEIDICPTCKGVWLDRGEIDKLAADDLTEKPTKPKKAKPADHNGAYAPPKAKDKKKRKKSLAERLGDVLEEVLD